MLNQPRNADTHKNKLDTFTLIDTLAGPNVKQTYEQFKIEQPLKELNDKISSEFDSKNPDRRKSKI